MIWCFSFQWNRSDSWNCESDKDWSDLNAVQMVLKSFGFHKRRNCWHVDVINWIIWWQNGQISFFFFFATKIILEADFLNTEKEQKTSIINHEHQILAIGVRENDEWIENEPWKSWYFRFSGDINYANGTKRKLSRIQRIHS